MARTLTDQAWADICAAAGPHCPDAEARALLSTVLFEEYPVFAYDRKRVAMRNERAKRMLRNLDAFVADYCTEFELTDDITRADAVANTVLIRPDLWCIEKLRRRAEAVLLYTEVIRRANARRQSNQRAMLYHRLFTAWLDHFDRATLTYSRIKADAPLSGPLVEFILTAMRQIMPEDDVPSREAVRDNIDRERDLHAEVKRQVRCCCGGRNVAVWGFDLHKRCFKPHSDSARVYFGLVLASIILEASHVPPQSKALSVPPTQQAPQAR